MQKTENTGRTHQNAVADFYRNLRERIQRGPATVRLKPNGHISVVDLSLWALENKFAMERVMGTDGKHTGEYRLAVRRETVLPKAA